VETFLVRVWTPGPREDPGPELRGVVLRVGTGRELVFVSGQELISFLAAEAAAAAGARPSGD
jgi:hypothetical protein